MRITVLGAGLAGVTAAYHLQQDGHEVTVVDRQPAAALETSFANAGLLSTGHAFAWASPRALSAMVCTCAFCFSVRPTSVASASTCSPPRPPPPCRAN